MESREEQATIKQKTKQVVIKFHYTKDKDSTMIFTSKLHGLSTKNEIQVKLAKVKGRA